MRVSEETHSGLVEEPNCQDPNGEDRAEGTNDFDTMVAEGVFVSCVALGNLKGADGNTKANHIRGNMGSI